MFKQFFRKQKHMLTLIRCYYKRNIDALEIYSKDFIIGILSNFILCAAEILMLVFVFDFVNTIDGWTLPQMLLLYSINQIGASLWACFCINTITLPYYIQNGEFDRFLLRPVSPLFQIMMDGFDDDSWGDLLIGILLLGYSWIKLSLPAARLLLLPVFCISAAVIYASITILLSTISFFTIAHTDAANLVNEFQTFAQYPLSIYPKVICVVFTFVFPISFVSFFPSMIILQKYSIFLSMLFPIVAFIFLKVSSKVWYWGLKHYVGTGT